ncbi:MAG: DUF4358 domain-containing protein [Ruminococcus sp.]|nr:DUF4358 domain-containing protein [Ruminococcus sp.]
MNRKILAAVAALALSITALTACGGSDSSSKADTAPASQTETKTEKDPAAIADQLKNGIAWKDQLNELESNMIQKIIGVKDGTYKSGKVYIGSGGTTAEEIACFEANDEAAADEIKASLEARVEAQKKAFENYVPAEMDKLNSAVIKKQGCYVFMCISDDNTKAEEIIG